MTHPPTSSPIPSGPTGPSRRRVGRPTGLQQRQRQSSRLRLLDAARDAFAQLSYAGTAVDDICRRAKVNRSTFYRHFDSKFAVAKALFDQFWPRLFAEYDRLPRTADLSDGAVAGWIQGLVDFYRANKSFFYTIGQIAVLEPEGLTWEETIRLEVVRLLGQRFPAFARASAPGAAEEDRVGVRLAMLTFERCLFELAFHVENYEPAAVRTVMIDEFRRFVRGELSSKGQTRSPSS
ncbi:MAG TPA: TetR/AcrR family transcriptional regulator [Alphaproteobacteria bacterium]|nr:TetR/AcrR family transcriptional regulator [Alphaproteobacteria bacterium]